MILINFLFLGLFTALLFPPYFIYPLGFIIFPLFYKQLEKLNIINSYFLYFLSGFFYGFGFLIIYLVWIKNPFYVNEATTSLTFLSYLLIIFLSLFFGIFFIFFKFLKDSYFQIFFIPFVLIILEITISKFWFGFPWISFALIISNFSIGSHLLYLFGSHLTGFIVIIIYLLPNIYFNYKKIIFKARKIIFPIFLLLIISLYFTKINLNNIKELKKIEVDLIQMNYSVSQNNQSSSNERYVEIINLIENSNADLILFGENNYPYLINNFNEIELGNFLKTDQTVIIGATRKENGKYFNSLLSIQKNKIDYFDKKILVPFGEFIPFRTYLGFMDIIAGSEDYSTGSKNRFIDIKNQYNFIPVICYEIIFSWDLLNKKNNFSDFIINITNDAWFGNLIGPYQHFYLTKIRASEFNKSLIRLSNNGISGIINNNGSVIISTQLNNRKIINSTFEFKNENNLVLFHKIFNFLIILLFLTFIYFSLIKKK